ncbi:MAG: YceI family protein [Silicimonas sp.]|jgi:polyisoprenoid-binding protein YceI|nr:YceI family protein [Silicimonas sp.]
MKVLYLAAASASLGISPVVAATWKPDPDHTEVVIAWKHAGLSFQTAKFSLVDGALDFTNGDVGSARADFSVIVDSLDAGVAQFTSDLKSADFFDAEAYPAIRFLSTSVEQTGEMSVRATGDLTVKDVTGPVTFDITVHGLGAHPLGQFAARYSGDWLGMTATATISRSAFGIGTFVPIGSDEVSITINTEMRAGGFE